MCAVFAFAIGHQKLFQFTAWFWHIFAFEHDWLGRWNEDTGKKSIFHALFPHIHMLTPTTTNKSAPIVQTNRMLIIADDGMDRIFDSAYIFPFPLFVLPKCVAVY